MIAHRCVVNMTATIFSDWDWPEDIRYLAATPITHAGGVNIFPTMMRGGFTRVLPGFDSRPICRTIEDEKINSVFLVPTMVYALIDAKEIRARKYDLSSLETIIYGAAPMSPDRLLEGMTIFGKVVRAVLRPDRGAAMHHDAAKGRSRSRASEAPRLLRTPEPAGRGEAVRFRHERGQARRAGGDLRARRAGDERLLEAPRRHRRRLPRRLAAHRRRRGRRTRTATTISSTGSRT